ncbi:MAG: hypothetical protein MZW92_19315 [Comamonadaceae bacterium]|nr:hypothetical protein [Comamonadaceae bacterium]
MLARVRPTARRARRFDGSTSGLGRRWRRRRSRAAPGLARAAPTLRAQLVELPTSCAGTTSRRARRARGLPGARHAAGVEPPRRLPVGAEVDAGARRAAGRAAAGATSSAPWRARAPTTRRAAGTGGDDARQPAAAVAQRRPTTPIPGDLRVVAGDLEGDSASAAGLKTLLADAFYWTDNDIVVQTRSMYGGAHRAARRQLPARPRRPRSRTSTTSATSAPRAAVASGADRGAAGTASARSGRCPGRAQTPSGCARRRARRERRPRRRRPAGGVRAAGHPRQQPRASAASASGSARASSAACSRLAYAFDRRRRACAPTAPIESGLRRRCCAHLARRRTRSSRSATTGAARWRTRPGGWRPRSPAALDARAASGQPVRLLAHSMGGLLARTMQLERPDVWNRMMSQRRARAC